jgi:peptidoglycan/LPS O-acetylase OafA/YrhL
MQNSSNRFHNNFDFLRIFAALTVIFSHSYALLGSTSDPVMVLTGITSGGIFAVGIFFVTSGYLITKSWERGPHAFRYLKKRVLRIFPALIVVVFLTVFLLGPFVTTLSLNDYFNKPQTWSYLMTIFLFYLLGGPSHYALPGVFANNPYPNVVNGSLWMLPYMFSMYVAVLALGFAGIIKKRLAVISVYLFAVLLLPIVTVHPLPVFSSTTVFWGICFVGGMVLYLYQDKIRLDYKIVLLSLFIWALSFHTAYGLYVSSLVFPYLVIYFAFIRTPRLHKLAKYGDFSYGFYIYAFPFQQLIVYFLVDTLTPAKLFGLSIIATFPAAVVSWFLIESRALKFK